MFKNYIIEHFFYMFDLCHYQTYSLAKWYDQLKVRLYDQLNRPTPPADPAAAFPVYITPQEKSAPKQSLGL